jgi:hypothetical protein
MIIMGYYFLSYCPEIMAITIYFFCSQSEGRYYLGTDTAPGAFIGNFHGGHSSWSVDNSVDSSGGLSGNTGTGYRIRIGEVG